MSDNKTIPGDILLDIKDIIKEKSGIIINEQRMLDFEIVIRNRIIKNNMNYDKFKEFLKKDRNELILIASQFTIQESSFYRNKSHFDRLKEEILPKFIKEKRNALNKNITILSAGCATGEEPYTIAMILTELIPDIASWNITIVATDINSKALDFCKTGVYTKYKLRNIDESYVDTFFIKKDANKFEVIDSIKSMITFKQCNLIGEPFELNDLNEVDVIFCENVIIYFCMESICRLIANFYKILRDTGFLFLGYSETLNMLEHNFQLSWWESTYAYQKILNKSQNVVESVVIHPVTEKTIDENILNKKSYKEIIDILKQDIESDDLNEAEKIIDFIDEGSYKTDAGYYLLKAEFLFDKQEYMNAAHICRKVLNIDPYNFDAHIMLSIIYIKLSMLDNAEYELKTSMYINNTSLLVQYYYAQFYKESHNEDNYKNYIEMAYNSIGNNETNAFNTGFFPLNKKMQSEILMNISNEKKNFLHNLENLN